MGVNGMDEYWVPEHVKEYLRQLGFMLPLDDMEPWIRSWDDWMSARGITNKFPIDTSCVIIGISKAPEEVKCSPFGRFDTKHYTTAYLTLITSPLRET